MKKCFFFCMILLSILTFLPACRSDKVSVCTFNVRGPFDKGENAWRYRRELVAEVIWKGNFDFIGTQEVNIGKIGGITMLDDMMDRLPGYEYYGKSREKTEAGESTPILWRKDRWEMDEKEHGVFWLSKTPEVSSQDWKAACPRTVVWGKFHELDRGKRTGRKIYFINTHFDHVSELARIKSAEMIAKFIAGLKDKDVPVILTGDFNQYRYSKSLTYLIGSPALIDEHVQISPAPLRDVYSDSHPGEPDCRTYHAFHKRQTRNNRIDFIFLRGPMRIVSSQIIRHDENDPCPSDHYPVSAVLEFGTAY
mgnify:CR=1 FL=1